jgi:hypothetical protein
VKKKFLLSHIGTPEVIHEDSIQSCAKLLMVREVLLLSNGASEPLAFWLLLDFIVHCHVMKVKSYWQ